MIIGLWIIIRGDIGSHRKIETSAVIHGIVCLNNPTKELISRVLNDKRRCS